MDLTKEADCHLPGNDVRLPARMKIRPVIRRFKYKILTYAKLIENTLHNALHIKEITFPIHSKRQLLSLVRKLLQRQGFRDVNIRKFI